MPRNLNSFGARAVLNAGGSACTYYSLSRAEEGGAGDLSRLPFSLKVMVENLLRHEDGVSVSAEDVTAVVDSAAGGPSEREIAFRPARVLMQDFTGVPAVVDLAAMRDAIRKLGGGADRINPLQDVDLVIDHSVQVDEFGSRRAFAANVDREFDRNLERYRFLKWGQRAFDNFRVVPPGTGIVHQVNLEYLAKVVFARERDGESVAYPDTLVGTDSHTTMINGLGVVGWGVGGIEAEAAMLGQPVSMLIPSVVGFRMTGALPAGATATDLVLTVTQMLRAHGVVGKFVEFCGPGLDSLSLPDRATIANMAPEYGATVGFFPVDGETLSYMELTGRDAEEIDLAEAYTKAQGLFRTRGTPDPVFSDALELDLGTVEPSMAGPRRPQDRVSLSTVKPSFRKELAAMLADENPDLSDETVDQWVDGNGHAPGELGTLTKKAPVDMDGSSFDLGHGSVVIAAITSCTNTSNPAVLAAAGVLAKKAVERGLSTRPWVKTSLAPGSQVVTRYLEDMGLLPYLEQLRFHVVGYGCTTCIGNSGPVPAPIGDAVRESDLVAAAVLSGNRNFEGRVNPIVKANYLASPPLVVAYALAGRMDVDLYNEPIGMDQKGDDVYLRDIWPTPDEVQEAVRASVRREMFQSIYADVFTGDDRWAELAATGDESYAWDDASTYVKLPPYFDGMPPGTRRNHGHPGCPRTGGARRFRHDGPYLAGRFDPGRQSRGSVPGRARRGAEGLQFIRRAAWQPRSHDAGYIRQHPAAQPPGAGHRGRLDEDLPRRRTGRHLRCRHGVPRIGHAPGGDRRQGIRLRLVPGLGRKGTQPPRRPDRNRGKLRAHSPEQPHRHGHPARWNSRRAKAPNPTA